MGLDRTARACLLDRESVYVQGWGILTGEEIVSFASEEKPWDSIYRHFRDTKGKPVCPVALVRDEERQWMALETDASEYGRPIEWTERTETLLRMVRAFKAEAQDGLRGTIKRNARKPSDGHN